MTVKFRNIMCGFKIDTDGTETGGFFQDNEFVRAYDVPVVWNDSAATLYFWNWRLKKTPANRAAEGLIQHPNFRIRGSAVVVTHVEKWHLIRVKGQVTAASLGVAGGLSGNVLFMPGGNKGCDTNIYVKDWSDYFFLICLIPPQERLN
jgi:hypothetical protein